MSKIEMLRNELDDINAIHVNGLNLTIYKLKPELVKIHEILTERNSKDSFKIRDDLEITPDKVGFDIEDENYEFTVWFNNSVIHIGHSIIDAHSILDEPTGSNLFVFLDDGRYYSEIKYYHTNVVMNFLENIEAIFKHFDETE